MITDRPPCSQRLSLGNCLLRRQREAEFGTVDTVRYRCKYVAWGRGPTLVCIPGMASDAASFVMLMAALQTHFRCVSYDLPDGDADGARLTGYRHGELVDDLFVLLEHLRIRETSVLGFSFGSTIALAAMARQPERFTHGILQGGFAHRPLVVSEVFLAQWGRFLPGRIGHLPGVHHMLDKTHRGPFLRRDADVWEFFLERQCRVPLRAFASRALMVNRLDLRPLLARITKPLLMVVGDRDPLVSKRCEQELKDRLPMVARAEIEECGHEAHLTHPEVLAEIVRQFLLPAACGERACER